MKHNKFILYALVILTSVALASCSVGLLQGTDKSSASQGNVSITVPPVSSPFQAMAVKAAALAGGSKALAPSPRAIVAASRVSFTYYKDGSWLKNGADVTPNLANDPGAGISGVTIETLEAGSYQVYVYVYNNYNDSYSPVVSGNAYFTVTAGGTTPVTVTCTPYNPVSLDNYYTTEASSYYFSLYTPWVLQAGGGIASFGTEGWFRFAATGLHTRITVKPDASSSSMASPYVALYDVNGSFVASGSPGPNGTVIEAITTTGNNYYLGVADFGSSSYSYRPMKIWFEQYEAVAASGEIMDFGVWKDFVLASGTTDWKFFNASVNVPYKVYWNDSYRGDWTKTKDIYAAGYHADQSAVYFSQQDSGYFDTDVPAVPVITPTSADQVQLKIWEYSPGSPDGTYALKIVPLAVSNADFSHFNLSNWTGIYNAIADQTAYLNKPVTGDYLPGWKFDFDGNAAATRGGAQIDIAAGSVRLIGDTRANKGDDGWGMTMTQEGISYTTTYSTTLDLSFTINSFGGGGCYYPYYEAPVKVFLKFNDAWHLLKGFTTNGYDWPNEGYITPSYPLTRSINLTSNYTVDGYYVNSGTVIQGVQIQSNGWYWDVNVNYVKLSN